MFISLTTSSSSYLYRIEIGLYARELGIDCLALIACLMFPRFVGAALCTSEKHVLYDDLQASLCDTQRQSHGALPQGHDSKIHGFDAYCGVLLLRISVCIMDVCI